MKNQDTTPKDILAMLLVFIPLMELYTGDHYFWTLIKQFKQPFLILNIILSVYAGICLFFYKENYSPDNERQD